MDDYCCGVTFLGSTFAYVGSTYNIQLVLQTVSKKMSESQTKAGNQRKFENLKNFENLKTFENLKF